MLRHSASDDRVQRAIVQQHLFQHAGGEPVGMQAAPLGFDLQHPIGAGCQPRMGDAMAADARDLIAIEMLAFVERIG